MFPTMSSVLTATMMRLEQSILHFAVTVELQDTYGLPECLLSSFSGSQRELLRSSPGSIDSREVGFLG